MKTIICLLIIFMLISVPYQVSKIKLNNSIIELNKSKINLIKQQLWNQ